MSQTASPERFPRPSRRTMLAVGVNLAAAAAGVGAWAAWRHASRPQLPETRFEGTIAESRGYHDLNAADVGYLPRPNQQVTARRITGGRLLYDVTYTIGPDGFRVVPASAGPQARASVLLFGDSNTFGEGVNDDETYANRLAEAGAGAVEVRNFAVAGWGPHQTLAGLQSGRFARTLARPPTHAIFFLIDDHIHRAIGEAAWDKRGPRYRVAGDGRPVRDGNFDSGGPPPAPPLDHGLLGWRPLFGYPPVEPPARLALTAAIVAEIAREIAKLAPDLRLHVLYWNDNDERLDGAIAGPLKAVGATVHTSNQFLPGYRPDWKPFVLSEVDFHPNPAAHRLIGDYIARRIVGIES